MIGYPTLVLGTLVAYLRASDETKPFVKGVFETGILGEYDALSDAVHFIQSGVLMLGGLIA